MYVWLYAKGGALHTHGRSSIRPQILTWLSDRIVMLRVCLLSPRYGGGEGTTSMVVMTVVMIGKATLVVLNFSPDFSLIIISTRHHLGDEQRWQPTHSRYKTTTRFSRALSCCSGFVSASRGGFSRCTVSLLPMCRGTPAITESNVEKVNK